MEKNVEVLTLILNLNLQIQSMNFTLENQRKEIDILQNELAKYREQENKKEEKKDA